MGKQWKQCQTLFSWTPILLWTVTAATKSKDACSLEKSNDKPRQCIKKQSHPFADKDSCNQSYGFSSSHTQMWQLDHKECWAPKNGCFQTVILEKTFESHLDSRRSNQWIIKETNPEYSLEGLMLKLQSFGHLMQRPDLLEKTLKLGKIEDKRRRGSREWDH